MIHIRNWFYYKIDNKVVYLCTNLLYWNSFENIVKEIRCRYDCTVETWPCPPSTDVLHDWVKIVNDAYDDASYDDKTGSLFFQNHQYLHLIALHFIVDNRGNRIGTVISGIYKEKQNIAGVCRIALLKSYQKRGIGQYLPLLGYSYLKDRVNIGESLIASKRRHSLFLHFKLGFRPVLSKELIAYTTPLQKVNCLQRFRLKWRLIWAYIEFLRK